MVQVYLGFKGEAGDSEPARPRADSQDVAAQAEPVDAGALQNFISNFQAAGGSVG